MQDFILNDGQRRVVDAGVNHILKGSNNIF